MKSDEAEKLIQTIRSLMEPDTSTSTRAVVEKSARKTQALGPGERIDKEPQPPAAGAFDDAALEKLYQSFKERILTECPIDPVLLHIVTTRPEIRIDVEPRQVALTEDSLRGRIALLIANGFIGGPTLATKRSAISSELSRTGSTPAGNRLSEALTSLVNDGILERGYEDGFTAPAGIKITKNVIERTR